jgi:alpha-1,3-mannosyltransferase
MNVEGQGLRRIGRVSIGVWERDAAIEQILADFACGQPRIVAFCNAHTVNLAAADEGLASVLGMAMVLNDGVGVDLASRLLYGEPFPSKLAGTDFVPALLKAAKTDLRIFLLGSKAGVAERAAVALRRLYPRHTVVGTHQGFFSRQEEEEVCRWMVETRPNLILVGMGQPQQEFWATRNFQKFAAVTMCVGAFLDFAAGTVPRAPLWLREIRLEWTYRLAHEPRRLWRRYLIGNFEFMLRLLHDRATRPRSSRRTRRRH